MNVIISENVIICSNAKEPASRSLSGAEARNKNIPRHFDECRGIELQMDM